MTQLEPCGDGAADEQAFTDIHGKQPVRCRFYHHDDRPTVSVAIPIDNYPEGVRELSSAVEKRGSDIAFRIRAELVCCQIFERVNVTEELTFKEARASKDWHDMCYFAGWSAWIAEGNCPGYETEPNICMCPCEGCKHNCGAHHEGVTIQNS